MKKDKQIIFTYGDIRRGLDRGLTTKEIFRQSGYNDWEKHLKQWEDSFKTLQETFERTKKTIDEKNKWIIEDNRFYEEKAKTKINDFDTGVLEKNQNLTWDEWLNKSGDEHFLDVVEWVANKKKKRLEMSQQQIKNLQPFQGTDFFKPENLIQVKNHTKKINLPSKMAKAAFIDVIIKFGYCKMTDYTNAERIKIGKAVFNLNFTFEFDGQSRKIQRSKHYKRIINKLPK